MIDCRGLLPEIWHRVFSYCNADVLGRFLLASYHSNTHLHVIAREVAIANLEARLSFFVSNNQSSREEESLKQFAKHLTSFAVFSQSDDTLARAVDQSLKCCVLWAYIDLMISLNKCSSLDESNTEQFLWTIATGPLKADFYEPRDDPYHAEVMEVHISSPFPWDPVTIAKINAGMSRGVHTNMYVTPIFSEDSIQNRVGLVTQVDHERDIHSYSFMHGNMVDHRWSHALVLGEEGLNKMYIWAETHPRMDSYLHEKFGEYAWMLDDVKMDRHSFLCTWQESKKACDEVDYDDVIQVLKGIIVRLKRYNRR